MKNLKFFARFFVMSQSRLKPKVKENVMDIVIEHKNAPNMETLHYYTYNLVVHTKMSLELWKH